MKRPGQIFVAIIGRRLVPGIRGSFMFPYIGPPDVGEQCPVLIPGMVLTAAALLDRNPKPTDAQIVEAMNGNLCRCCGYPNLIAAVKKAAEA